MNKGQLSEKFSRGFHNFGLQLKKHSPTILVVTGVVGVVASTVLACKATTKLESILKESNEHVEKIHECMNNKELIESGEYTEKDGKKDLTIVYTQTAMKLVKLYAPAVITGALSIASIVASHSILNKRNVAISAAYAMVDKSFKEYRENVKKRFGDKADFELLHNVKAEKIETVEVDENGNTKKEEKEIYVAEGKLTGYSPYAVVFDESNPNWQRDAEYNKMFLVSAERYMNDRLKRVGYVFLNDVYDYIGHPKTKAGQVVGWVYDEKSPVGDNYIDFGIFNIHSQKACDFVNGYEKSIVLDFNVDGNILDLLPKYSRA